MRTGYITALVGLAITTALLIWAALVPLGRRARAFVPVAAGASVSVGVAAYARQEGLAVLIAVGLGVTLFAAIAAAGAISQKKR